MVKCSHSKLIGQHVCGHVQANAETQEIKINKTTVKYLSFLTIDRQAVVVDAVVDATNVIHALNTLACLQVRLIHCRMIQLITCNHQINTSVLLSAEIKWDTKENTGKSRKKNALYVLQYCKRHTIVWRTTGTTFMCLKV